MVNELRIHLTNTEVVISCLVCFKDVFKIIQERKERIATSSEKGYHDFVVMGDEPIIIETLDLERNTDKHASI